MCRVCVVLPSCVLIWLVSCPRLVSLLVNFVQLCVSHWPFLNTGGHKSGNSANGTAAYLITSVSSPKLSTLYYNTTKYIKHHCLFLFSCKHINSRKNVVQGTYMHYSETKYYIKQRCLFSVSFNSHKNVVHATPTCITIKQNDIKHHCLFVFFKI